MTACLARLSTKDVLAALPCQYPQYPQYPAAPPPGIMQAQEPPPAHRGGYGAGGAAAYGGAPHYGGSGGDGESSLHGAPTQERTQFS